MAVIALLKKIAKILCFDIELNRLKPLWNSIMDGNRIELNSSRWQSNIETKADKVPNFMMNSSNSDICWIDSTNQRQKNSDSNSIKMKWRCHPADPHLLFFYRLWSISYNPFGKSLHRQFNMSSDIKLSIHTQYNRQTESVKATLINQFVRNIGVLRVALSSKKRRKTQMCKFKHPRNVRRNSQNRNKISISIESFHIHQ